VAVPALVGRAEQLSEALGVLRRAGRQRHGAALLVTGEAGIGKSALLREVAEQAGRTGFVVGVGKAQQVGQVAPGAALLLALRSGRPPIVAADDFDALSSLAGSPVWLIDRIGRLLEQRSRSAPVLVVVDDLHWADHVTQVAVRLLADRLIGLPVVWLLAARGTPEDLAARLDLAGSAAFPVHAVALGPLDDAAVDSIAAQILGAAPDAALTERLRGAAGNPLVALQYLSGTLGGAAAAPLLGLPMALPAAVRRRLRALPPDARAAVRLIAIWGEPMSRSDLVAMSPDRSPDAVSAAVHDACAADLLVEQDDLLRLRHDLVREAVYDDVPAATRAVTHGRCAEHLLATGRDALTAAPHLRAAAQLGDARAVQVLRRAADQSLGPLPETAAELAKRAFELVPASDPSWLEVGEHCASILVAVQHSGEALEVVDLLLTRVVDDEVRARLEVLAAPALWLGGALNELVRRVDASMSGSVADGTRARLSAWRAVAMSRVETADAARDVAQRVLRQARASGDVTAEHVALQALGEVARNTLDHRAALTCYRTLRINAGASHLGPELAALRLLDRFDEAESVIGALGREIDAAQFTGLLPVVEGRMWQHYMLGRLDHAQAEALTLERLSRALEVPIAELEATMVLVLVAILRGDLADARRRMRDARRRNPADQMVRGPRLTLLASLLADLAGDHAGAVAMVRPVMALAEQSHGYFPRLPEWMLVHAEMAMSAGDDSFARQSADRAQRAADRNPVVASLRGIALQTRGVVEGDVDLLASAVRRLEQSPRPELRARARLDLGRALLRAGDRPAAVAPLQQAYALFEGMGATLPARTAADAARSAGAPVRTRTPSGPWPALTPAELRVAELISAGLTNDAAARRLGISANTVATHLRAVFAKLDVNSRVQLANRWRDPSDGGPAAVDGEEAPGDVAGLR
jgi:DNA-binding CsgD family transcriptional regulator